MKNIFKFLMVGLMMFAFTAATVPSVFAQDEATDIYKKFTDNYKKTDKEGQKVAIQAGEEFIQKFGTNPDYKAQADFINRVVPKLKTAVGEGETIEAFTTAVQGKNWDNAFSSGKTFLANSPDNIDVMIVLASIGFDNAIANPPVDKYNADAINYAKAAIQKINEGKTSGNGNYGAFGYEYKTTKYADGKNNALGAMNYTIGFIMANRMKQKKEALPYLYKATQTPGFSKDSPDAYAMIGSYYVDEYNRIVADRAAKIQANENKETPETRNALGEQYAVADRALNAYAIAHKVAEANPDVKPDYKNNLMKILTGLYKGRFEKEDGMPAYIAQAKSSPLVDPATAITPVAVEALPETTPTTTGTPTTTTTPSATPTTTPSASPTPKPAPSASTSPKKP